MQLSEIQGQVYDKLQLSATPPAAVVTRVLRYINRWHRKGLTAKITNRLRRVQVPLASVADQWAYGIGLDPILYITERDNDLKLLKKTETWWRTRYADPSNFSGTPRYWVPLGYTRVSVQPSDASELFAISTSAADTTQTIYVEAIRTSGAPVSLSVTLTGTTGVSLDTSITDVVGVVDVYLSASCAGTVTLREDSGTGTALSTITPSRTYPRYNRFALAPTPSAAITYYLEGVAPIVQMANATDEPLFPEDFHDILVDGAVYDDWIAHGRLKDAQWKRDEIKERMLEMRNWVWLNLIQPEAGGEDSAADIRSFEDTIVTPVEDA